MPTLAHAISIRIDDVYSVRGVYGYVKFTLFWDKDLWIAPSDHETQTVSEDDLWYPTGAKPSQVYISGHIAKPVVVTTDYPEYTTFTGQIYISDIDTFQIGFDTDGRITIGSDFDGTHYVDDPNNANLGGLGSDYAHTFVYPASAVPEGGIGFSGLAAIVLFFCIAKLATKR